ncbi:MAG: lipase family protein [Gallionellaceae bacterium]
MTTMPDLLYPGDATDFFSRRPLPPFAPNTASYSSANALWLAELSRLVYRHDAEEDTPPPQPTQTGFLAKSGCTKRQFFLSRETNTQAMLVEFGGTAPFAVLAFRGTEQHIKDFITDLTLGKINRTDGQIDVHEGFKQALDSVWSDIEKALQQIHVPIFFTGHSLGAALATLAAARRTPAALYTFGSPRVGDADFTASLKNIADIIHRVVDDEDIVATVPPAEFGFEHIGTLHALTAPSRNLTSWLRGLFGPPKFLADHAPINYVDRL